MTCLFIFFVFAIMCYSLTQMLVYMSGPFRIFERFRNFMHGLNDQLGELISCEFCTSTWTSFFISALNVIFIPTIAFTPFNLILGSTGLWWLIIFLDGLLGSGCTWLLFRLEDYLTLKAEETEDGK